MPRKRIAITTGGGDAPGLNAVIRAIVLAALNRGWECYGIRDGFNGLLTPENYPQGGLMPLDLAYLRWVEEIAISPDGGHVAYTVRQVDVANNGYTVDVFLLGEAEELLLEFLEAYQEAADQAKADREAFLQTLANLNGAYVPRFYRPDYRSDGSLRKISIAPSFPGQVKKRFVENIDARVTTSVIRTPHTEFGNMTLLEVNRGCARGCRFCSTALFRASSDRLR